MGFLADDFCGKTGAEGVFLTMNRDELLDGAGESKFIEVRESGGVVCVFVSGRPYMRWRRGDEESQRMAIVQLHECGHGTHEQLAEAFGVHVNTVQKYTANFSVDGCAGLNSQRRGPQGGWKLTARRRGKILTVALREVAGNVEGIQARLREAWHEEISLTSIRQVLEENGLLARTNLEAERKDEQGDLFDFEGDRQLRLDLAVDEAAENRSAESDDATAPKPRAAAGSEVGAAAGLQERRRYSSAQRAYLDGLEREEYNAYAGGLLFVPLVERYEFLPTLRRAIEIPTHEGYSLEELCLTLFYMDIFGFRSMEDFKRAYGEEFGVLMGLSQSPSLFTLRRFLHKVRKLGTSEKLIDEFAACYLRNGLAQWGVMYIDGHFLPYHGMTPVSMGWHGVRQTPMKGGYNFLAVDEKFRPWLFLIRGSSEDLLQKIPELVAKAKKIGLAAGLSEDVVSKLIVVFDREGYSAELYRWMDGEGGGPRNGIFITWAKYADKWVGDLAEEAFNRTVKVEYAIRGPEEIRYVETTRMMNKYGKIRAIVIQSGREKRRAAIYTNGGAEDVGAEMVVRLMCRRWGEENQIKELLLKHRINYMPGYVTEALDEQPLVDNPKAKELKKRRAALQGELHRFKVQLANEVLKARQGDVPIQIDGFPIMENIVRTDHELLLLSGELEPLPEKVRFDEAHDGEKLMALNYEKKRFLDCIKVFACNLTVAMCQMLLRYYDRRKEILPALSMILERSGEVSLQDGQLRVRLRRFRNPEIDYAARRLCEDLNRMQPRTLDRFRIPLHYEIA